MSNNSPDIEVGPSGATAAYTNPVFRDYFADPFVWQYKGEYYAVGTGPVEASGHVDDAERAASTFLSQHKVFPLLRSDDFVNWSYVGGALVRPDHALGDTFWAPEVAFNDGTFYLYYSVGHEDKNHQLRVASSRHPMGPYADLGVALVDPSVCTFAIDPHAFLDDDGQWYLFYARDFLDRDNGSHAGTALVVDRLIDMTRLAGDPRVVLRARSAWQLFLAGRTMYDKVWDWYTMEGPCVRAHEGKYYCFYSGGRWESEGYGVDYGVADHPLGPYSDAGNEEGARVLRSAPGALLGPGHNSIVTGPDGATPYIAYHAWDPGHSARRMCIDRLIWTADGPRCAGPTTTPQTVEHCSPSTW